MSAGSALWQRCYGLNQLHAKLHNFAYHEGLIPKPKYHILLTELEECTLRVILSICTGEGDGSGMWTPNFR